MEYQPHIEELFRLSLLEMDWIMDRLGSSNLEGIQMDDLKEKMGSDRTKTSEKVITTSLKKKGILHPDKEQGFEWDPRARVVLDSVLFPEHMLMIVRDQHGEGRRIFRVLRKGEAITLHSFPNNREHFIGVIHKPEDIQYLVNSWFPFHQLPIGTTKFKIKKLSFDEFGSLLINRKREEAEKAFDLEGVDSNEKLFFLHSLKNTTISGSIARITVREGRIAGGDSIAFLTDGRVGWSITEDNSPDPGEAMLTVRRIGLDFAGVVRGMVEAFSGKILPRRQVNPTNNTVRFALTQNELVKALAAINCQDLSKKMYAGFSQDNTGKHYDEQMDLAQRSLVDAGLCTLSEHGMPILADDLAYAVLPLGTSNALISVIKSAGGPPDNLGIYLSQGSQFTAYLNYGEQLQILELGPLTNLISYIESFFPDFGTEDGRIKIASDLSYETLEKVTHKVKDKQEAISLLLSDGMADSAAQAFAKDAVETRLHATITRNDMPDRKKTADEISEKKQPIALFLLKSSRRSWMIQFTEPSLKGRATVTDREGFEKALSTLIA